MDIKKWIKRLFGDTPTDVAENQIKNWQEWVIPFKDSVKGEDSYYHDDFEKIREEISKSSDINVVLILQITERLLKEKSKDLRLAVYYTYARLLQDGLSGFADGLELLCALIKAFGKDIYPQKPLQRKQILDWLYSERLSDILQIIDMNHQKNLERSLSAIVLLQNLVSNWEEAYRPSFIPLLNLFERVLNEQNLLQVRVSSSNGEATLKVPSIDISQNQVTSVLFTSIQSDKDLLDFTRQAANYLREQKKGVAAFQMIRAIRWDSLKQLPPTVTEKCTRLPSPRIELQNSLKQLIVQKEWDKLSDRVELAFMEGANHFWLDLQYYAWQVQQNTNNYMFQDSLFRLLQRFPELPTLKFDDGTPFANNDTLIWLESELHKQDQKQNELSIHMNTVSENWQEIEQQAETIVKDQGIQQALSWMQNLPHSSIQEQGRQFYNNKLLIMARLCEKYEQPDWAIYLYYQVISDMEKYNIVQWDTIWSFQVYSNLYRLLILRQKLESNNNMYREQIINLQNYLMSLDPATTLTLLSLYKYG